MGVGDCLGPTCSGSWRGAPPARYRSVSSRRKLMDTAKPAAGSSKGASAPAEMRDGAGVIVDYLIREKVPYAFGLCGHGNIGFLDALHDRSNEIKTISVRHESVAGFMADVYYRVSGKPTATFTSCGPGSANLPISLANAFFDSVPFLAITGNVPTSQFNRGAFQEAYRHYQADFPSTVQAYCKRVFQPTTRRAMVPLAGAPGLENDGHRTARSRGARRALRYFQGRCRRGHARTRGMERQYLLPLRCGPRRRVQGGRYAAGGASPRNSGGTGCALWRGNQGTAGAGGTIAHPGRLFRKRSGRHRLLASAGAGARGAQRHLSGQPRRAPGRCAACARRAVRRPHLEFVAAGLLVHDSADEADPRRHRSGRDCPQLSRRAGPDGRRADVPAPGSCGIGSAQVARRGAGRAGGVAGCDRQLSQGMGRLRRARHSPTIRRRSIRSARPSRSTRPCPRTRSW